MRPGPSRRPGGWNVPTLPGPQGLEIGVQGARSDGQSRLLLVIPDKIRAMPAGPSIIWRVMGMSQGLEEPEDSLRARSAKRIGLDPEALRGFRIARRSVDARRKRGALSFVCHVDLVADVNARPRSLRKELESGRTREAPQPTSLLPGGTVGPLGKGTAVVVGSGPAGVFAALVLAMGGTRVTLLERGARIEQRHKRLVPFHRGGELDQESNLLYGEGGAGTYSDGKLYTRVDHPLEVPLLEELVAAGAPEDILYDSRAHIGTDKLHRVLPVLRARLEALGVTFAFDTRFEGLVQDLNEPGKVRAVRTTQGEIPCDAVVLAVGHSARDTWQMLAEEGVPFEAKPFQLGVRVEHPQELITRGRYGSGAGVDLLGPAAYALTCRASEGASAAHSFCMCPGGRMVASISEPGFLCTNGMSNSTHSSRWANSALVTTLSPPTFAAYGEGPFAGVALQRALERKFFEAGDGAYGAPGQRVPDFLDGKLSTGELDTSYTFGAVPGRIDQLLPPLVTEALRSALMRWGQNLAGFDGPEGLLVGVESRSSGPVRIPRDRERFTAEGWSNLYPVGEGAGHAGGIMSAAIDGAAAAQRALAPV
jgi:uncharacterized protein